jgi:hypothetical protein
MTARKIAVDAPTTPPPTARQNDATGRTADNPAAGALQEIVTYIPTEIVSLYVAWTGVLGQLTASRACDADYASRWIEFWIFLGATPIFVFAIWALQRSRRTRTSGKRLRFPLGEAFVSTVAFGAWAFALPATPFADYCWYDSKYGTPTLLTVLAFFALFGRSITRNPRPSGG